MTIKAKGLKKQLKRFKKLAGFDDLGMEANAKIAETDVKKRVPVDQGKLKKSMRSKSTSRTATVFSNSPYAAALNYGRKSLGTTGHNFMSLSKGATAAIVTVTEKKAAGK